MNPCLQLPSKGLGCGAVVEPLTSLPPLVGGSCGSGSVVEHLCSMPEVLGLISRTIKNKINTCSHSSWAMGYGDHGAESVLLRGPIPLPLQGGGPLWDVTGSSVVAVCAAPAASPSPRQSSSRGRGPTKLLELGAEFADDAGFDRGQGRGLRLGQGPWQGWWWWSRTLLPW